MLNRRLVGTRKEARQIFDSVFNNGIRTVNTESIMRGKKLNEKQELHLTANLAHERLELRRQWRRVVGEPDQEKAEKLLRAMEKKAGEISKADFDSLLKLPMKEDVVSYMLRETKPRWVFQLCDFWADFLPFDALLRIEEAGQDRRNIVVSTSPTLKPPIAEYAFHEYFVGSDAPNGPQFCSEMIVLDCLPVIKIGENGQKGDDGTLYRLFEMHVILGERDVRIPPGLNRSSAPSFHVESSFEEAGVSFDAVNEHMKNMIFEAAGFGRHSGIGLNVPEVDISCRFALESVSAGASSFGIGSSGMSSGIVLEYRLSMGNAKLTSQLQLSNNLVLAISPSNQEIYGLEAVYRL